MFSFLLDQATPARFRELCIRMHLPGIDNSAIVRSVTSLYIKKSPDAVNYHSGLPVYYV